MRHFMIGLVAVGSLVMMVAGLAVAQSGNPDATLTLSEGSVAAGIGFSWGNGVLTYKGKTYPVRVEGLSVGELGVARATAKGEVSHLAKLADFPGNYAAVGAGATAGGGGGHRAPEHDPGRESQARYRGRSTHPCKVGLAELRVEDYERLAGLRGCGVGCAARPDPPRRLGLTQVTRGSMQKPA